MRASRQVGFTLIELITVIVIIGILATMSTNIITLPVQAYVDLARRTTLVDNADTALRLMQRDIRRALPNSLRLNAAGTSMELLHTSEGGRYRAQKASDGSGNTLDFSTADASFDVIGSLNNAPQGELVIYNLGSGEADAYAGTNRATLASSANTTSIVLTAAKQFPLASPHQRFYVVDTPITYRCDGGRLLRYSDYPISSTAADPPSSVTGQLLVNQVGACQFVYTDGTATNSGLLSLQLTLTDDAGESVFLLHQVHVDNAP